MPIDAHCHLFNKDVLSGWIRILMTLMNLENVTGAIAKGTGEGDAGNARDYLKRINKFLSIGLKDSSEDIYEEMMLVYGNGFIVVPLMLDLSYVATKEEHDRFVAEYFDSDKLFSNINDNIGEIIEKITGRDVTGELKEELDDFRSKYLHLKDKTKSLREKIDIFDHGSGFKKQIKQLSDIKKKYPDKVFPFFSVDPRRYGIIQMVKDKVGLDKKFRGIKLYAPLGFSPTHPVLMEKGGLYDYCQEHKIPVTVHCSNGGFATFSKSVTVTGYVYRNGSAEYVTDKKIEFKHNLPDFKKMVLERAVMLNHPEIWKKVLEEYKDLRINFAHLGGDDASWTSEILWLMGNYDNVYTDLSCCADDDRLKKIKLDIYDKASDNVKNKIMYGSDFYILMLFEDELSVYLKTFRDIFGGEFRRISEDNPRRFLS
ncbi:MAG: hypothetical protein EPN94_02855 [Nitrospirae bacterium]|nr:MAG: hypothetical protein EPN94_02855 [Nitrospirota bacterium]